jgi:ribosome-associated translation inhibitor RaiA
MEAIEAVLELAKERDELANEIEMYEEWFETLVGKNVTLAVKHKKKTRFVECTVTVFNQGEGWELTSDDVEDEVYMITFDDLFNGKVTINN